MVEGDHSLIAPKVVVDSSISTSPVLERGSIIATRLDDHSNYVSKQGLTEPCPHKSVIISQGDNHENFQDNQRSDQSR